MVQLICYTKNVVTDVENAARDLAVHRSNTGLEHWKELGCLIEYLIVENTKGIIIIKPKVLRRLCFAIPIMPQTSKQKRVSSVQSLHLEENYQHVHQRLRGLLR